MKKAAANSLLKIYTPLLQKIREEFNPKFAKLETDLDLIKDVNHKVNLLQAQLAKTYDIVRANFDDLQSVTRQLQEVRTNPSYGKAFEDQPLISVCIATYNRPDKLLRAIKTVQEQTYQKFEIIIVGDHCTDDTEERVKKLDDKRISFYNLPTKTVYPEDRVEKWMVMGTIAKNHAVSLAKGEWIATLDDDDEYFPEHLEKLLKHAKETRCEMVYGASRSKNLVTGKESRLWDWPPNFATFTFHSALYMRAISPLFKYNLQSWTIDEPHDWDLCRRMMQSGVLISSIKDELGYINMIPAGHKTKDY